MQIAMSTLSDANKSTEEAAKADNSRTEEDEAKKNSSQKGEKTQGNTDTSTITEQVNYKSIDLCL